MMIDAADHASPAAGPLARPGRAAGARWQGAALLAALLLALAPLWLAPQVPTQDGPLHLESAAQLAALRAGGGAPEVYAPRWRLGTNQLYGAALVGLEPVLPLELAERLLLSLAVVAAAAAAVAAAALAGGGAAWPAVLVLPALLGTAFHMGFVNLAFGWAPFALSLGLAWRVATRAGPAAAGGLAACGVAAFLAHPVAGAAVVAGAGLALAGGLVGAAATRGRAAALGAAALAPTAALLLAFFATAPGEGNQILGLGETLRQLVGTPPEPVRRGLRLLRFASSRDLLVSVPLHLLTAGALVAALRRPGEPRRALLLPALLLAALVAIAPGRIGELGWLPDRLAPFAYLAAAVGLGALPWRRRTGAALALAALLLVAGSTLLRARAYDHFARLGRDYLGAARVLEPGDRVLALHLDHGARLAKAAPATADVRFDPLLHAGSHLVRRAGAVSLRNHQATTTYFPLRYRADHRPARLLAPADGEARLEGRELRLDLAAYRRRAGRPVDVVLLWGAPDAVPPAAVAAELAASYDLVHVSPRGLLRAYRARPPVPPSSEVPR